MYNNNDPNQIHLYQQQQQQQELQYQQQQQQQQQQQLQPDASYYYQEQQMQQQQQLLLMQQHQYQQRQFKLQSEDDFPALTGAAPQQKASKAATWDGSAIKAKGTAEGVASRTVTSEGNTNNMAADRFGLVGLLGVIRMTDADLNTLALGTDLTTLGLDLSSEQSLCNDFSGAIHSNSVDTSTLSSFVPQCYKEVTTQRRLQNVSDDTLFFVFYNYSGADDSQLQAARELCNRQWSYHKRYQVWLQSVVSSFVVWDVHSWTRVECVVPFDAQDLLDSSKINEIIVSTSQLPVQQGGGHRGSLLLSSGNERLDGGDPLFSTAGQSSAQLEHSAIGGTGYSER